MQFEKAKLPIILTDAGMNNAFNKEQSLNAYPPISSTDVGMITCFNDRQC